MLRYEVDDLLSFIDFRRRVNVKYCIFFFCRINNTKSKYCRYTWKYKCIKSEQRICEWIENINEKNNIIVAPRKTYPFRLKCVNSEFFLPALYDRFINRVYRARRTTGRKPVVVGRFDVARQWKYSHSTRHVLCIVVPGRTNP